MRTLPLICMTFALCLGGCGTEPILPVLPPSFRIVGAASGTDGRLFAKCEMDLIVNLETENIRNDTLVEYSGFHGGAYGRTVVDSEGAGIGLLPDVYGPIVARVLDGDSLQFTIPINGETESRFWNEVTFMPGVWRGDWMASSGVWTCAPFDIFEGGWVDTALTVEGTWRLEPVATSE